MSRSTYALQFRRKRKGLTNYKKRLKLILSGKPRILVRISSNRILGQVIQYEKKGDKVVCSAVSSELRKLGWNCGLKNVPAAYLTGLLLAKKAKEKGAKTGVADIGFHTSVNGSRVYAFVKGLADGGMSVAASDDVLPPDERIKGQHISAYAKKSKGHQFSKSPGSSEIEKVFEQVKEKLA